MYAAHFFFCLHEYMPLRWGLYGQYLLVVSKYTVQIINPSSERVQGGYSLPSEIIKLSSVTGYRLRERHRGNGRDGEWPRLNLKALVRSEIKDQLLLCDRSSTQTHIHMSIYDLPNKLQSQPHTGLVQLKHTDSISHSLFHTDFTIASHITSEPFLTYTQILHSLCLPSSLYHSVLHRVQCLYLLLSLIPIWLWLTDPDI